MAEPVTVTRAKWRQLVPVSMEVDADLIDWATEDATVVEVQASQPST